MSSYIDKAIDVRQRIEQAGVKMHIEQLPIIGMTKESAFAMRYHLQDGQAGLLSPSMHPLIANDSVLGSPNTTSSEKCS